MALNVAARDSRGLGLTGHADFLDSGAFSRAVAGWRAVRLISAKPDQLGIVYIIAERVFYGRQTSPVAGGCDLDPTCEAAAQNVH